MRTLHVADWTLFLYYYHEADLPFPLPQLQITVDKRAIVFLFTHHASV